MNSEWVILGARLLVPLCAFTVLGAVALNFVAAAEGAGAVKVRRRSPVATASMLGFLLVVYVLIHQRIGEFQVPSLPAVLALSVAGAALVLIGCAVNILGRLRLGGNWANQVTVYEEQTLVTGGVFGLVRHPLYASLIWMFVGASLVYLNTAALAATLLVFVPAMRYRAAQEERLLSERFPEYKSYQSRVGRLIPRMRRRAAR